MEGGASAFGEAIRIPVCWGDKAAVRLEMRQQQVSCKGGAEVEDADKWGQLSHMKRSAPRRAARGNVCGVHWHCGLLPRGGRTSLEQSDGLMEMRRILGGYFSWTGGGGEKGVVGSSSVFWSKLSPMKLIIYVH